MSAHAKIELKIFSLDELRPHEETVPRLFEKLTRTMIRDGVQRDPVIVDRGSMIVLDGMHRVRALRALGVRNAVCFPLDYMNEETQLFSWFRFVENPSVSMVEDVAESVGLQREVELPRDGSVQLPGAVLTYRGRAYASETGRSPVEVAADFDREVRKRGAVVRYMDEARASSDLLQGAYMTLLVPRLSKEEVVRRGVQGALLPPKTTLHVFPARPMGVNYPLSFLRDGTDTLAKILSSRRMRKIEAPSFYHGRLYREPVVVFE